MESSEIRTLADEYFEYLTETNPTEAHMRGDYRYADRWEDFSHEAEDVNIAKLREFGARASAIDPAGLSADDALTREVLIFETETKAALEEMHMAEFAVDPIFGLQVHAKLLPPMLSVPTTEVADAMVEKYKGYGHSFDQLTERYRQGIESGRTPAAFAVDGVIAQLDEWLALPIDEDPLLNTQVPPDFSDEQTAAWKAALTEVISDHVRPAVARQRDALRDEVLPAARPEGKEGLCWLPDGDVAFLSDRKPAYAYCFVTTSPVLYRMDRDGANQKRLSANYLMDFTPSVLNDGRIIYTRWDYINRHDTNFQSLWVTRPDGTAVGHFYGNYSVGPCMIAEARAIPDSQKVVATATGIHERKSIKTSILAKMGQSRNRRNRFLLIISPSFRF